MVALIILVIAIVLSILAVLYLKTDAFKSNQVLFSKYFLQSFNNLEKLENEEVAKINEILNSNKYNAQLIRKY